MLPMIVASKSARTLKVAGQLRELMDRHRLKDAPALSRLCDKIGKPVDYVTINRILNAQAKTEPKVATLRKLAEAVSETYEDAFPEQPQVAINVGERRLALKSLDGKPIPAAVLAKLAELGVEVAETVSEAKKKLRTPKP